MKFQTQQFTVFAILLIVLSGCQSGEFVHYISPKISGRVLAADTQRPLAGVRVTRVGQHHYNDSSDPPKGGQLLMQSGGVQTDASGRFVLNGVSVFAVFRQPGWSTVTVAFNHSGYESFQTNYTRANVKDDSTNGMSLVNAGDVLLHPFAK